VLGFYIKTPRGFSRDRPHYRMLHICVCVCVKGEFEDQDKRVILCYYFHE
jgi:hypothetical protein